MTAAERREARLWTPLRLLAIGVGIVVMAAIEGGAL